MSVIRWKSFAAGREASLCATCSWGTVRKGHRNGEAETFCRLIGPSSLVPFAIRECSGYCDRRVPSETAEAKSTDRRFGFVTTLTLRDESTK
jgi:hypothetical protein